MAPVTGRVGSPVAPSPETAAKPAAPAIAAATPDAIPLADDLCEILYRRDYEKQRAQLVRLLETAGPRLDGALIEVARRGHLGRLLPTAPSELAARTVAAVIQVVGEAAAWGLAEAWIRRATDYDGGALDRLLRRCDECNLLAALFRRIIDGGLYEAMLSLLLRPGWADAPVLRALAAARPMYRRDELNAATRQSIAADAKARALRRDFYDVLIVPGFTPVNASRPVPLSQLPAAQQRLDLCLAELRAGRGGYVLVTGGAVHPPGTPCNEGLMMRDYLLQQGLAPQRILVEPHARHSTTNLRNAGRMMLAHGLPRGLIVSGFDNPVFGQAFYFGVQWLSSFEIRCQQELGYRVGDLRAIDGHRVAFTPAPEVTTPLWRDPLDV